MTKKEQLRMRELENRISGLESRNAELLRMYGVELSECINYKARIRSIEEVINWPIGEEFKI